MVTQYILERTRQRIVNNFCRRVTLLHVYFDKVPISVCNITNITGMFGICDQVVQIGALLMT